MSNCPITITSTRKNKPLAGEALGFGRIFTDHMFVMDYHSGQGWHDARIVPYAAIELDPSAMVLHYSQTIFEGMKAYRRADGGINLFRPELNFERLNSSAERMAIPTIDGKYVLACLEDLLRIDADWIPSEAGTSLYIRPFIIATDALLGVRASNSYKLMILLSPSGSYYAGGLKPTSIYVEDHYVRAVRGGIGAAKTGGNYAASVKSQQQATEKAYDQVLWLDGIERRYIEEVGAMNVFFVSEGKLLTPKLTGSILPGITRRSVIELATSLGYDVQETQITIEELIAGMKSGTVTEGFGSGTAAVISPIGNLTYDGETINFGETNDAGPVALALYETLTGIQYGTVEDRYGWIHQVN